MSEVVRLAEAERPDGPGGLPAWLTGRRSQTPLPTPETASFFALR